MTYSRPPSTSNVTPPNSLTHTGTTGRPPAIPTTISGTGTGSLGTVTATRLPDVEPVYGTVIQLARLVWRVQGLKFTVTGVENLPRTGGAVVAINHTSYFDFTFAGLPAYKQHLGRKVRFMAKTEVFDHKITGPIMRSLRHIEVDRARRRSVVRAGLPGSSRKASWSASTRRPRSAAASRSRNSSRVPPGWRSPPTCRSCRTSSGAHSASGPRAIPKKMWRPKVPITVAVGEPIMPTLPPDGADRACCIRGCSTCWSRCRTRTGRIHPVSSGCRTGWAAVRRRWPRPTGWTPRRPCKKPERRPPRNRSRPTGRRR